MIPIRTLAAMRFGYGLPLPAGAPEDTATMLRALAGPDLAAQDWPIMGLSQVQPILTALHAIKNEGRDDPALAAQREALQAQLAGIVGSAQRLTFARALGGADGFRERLVAFWADHFSVIAVNAMGAMLPLALVEDAIRPHVAGSFAKMLTAVTLHPAMLLYLDQVNSVGPNSALGRKQGKGLNENLAREVIELHSLGVGGGYMQADVTEMAKLLTGLTYRPEMGMVYQPRRAEPGPKTVLGRRYETGGMADIHAALADLAQRPETAQHIARKLVVHFVADQPDESLVATMAAAFVATEGNLLAVCQAMLNHPAAWDQFAAKARQPFDFLIAAARALGLSSADLMAMEDGHFKGAFLLTMADLGQPFKRPAGPNGFPEEAEAWVTPQGLAQRITWAMSVPHRLIGELPDPATLARLCLAERASEALLWATARAEDRAQGVGLVLASAEFNRR